MPDRSFVAFLRAARSEPGAALRLLSFAAFAVALFADRGIVAVLVAVGIGLTVGLAIGFPYFRWRGRLLGGSGRRP
jgi:hypothetical protein